MWVRTNMDQWKYLVSFWNRSATHYQRSKQGEKKYTQKWTPDNVPTDDELQELARESCATAYGSLIAILHCTKPVRVQRKCSADVDAVGARGRLVLFT